ncbi:unannotated protein [freshwater metagenome]|uniref:Unannotated protein n=1 Tax=freshwater metagenome TaxID=449393 RepID=A0A6J7NDJ8_9ZZZZ
MLAGEPPDPTRIPAGYRATNRVPHLGSPLPLVEQAWGRTLKDEEGVDRDGLAGCWVDIERH